VFGGTAGTAVLRVSRSFKHLVIVATCAAGGFYARGETGPHRFRPPCTAVWCQADSHVLGVISIVPSPSPGSQMVQ